MQKPMAGIDQQASKASTPITPARQHTRGIIWEAPTRPTRRAGGVAEHSDKPEAARRHGNRADRPQAGSLVFAGVPARGNPSASRSGAPAGKAGGQPTARCRALYARCRPRPGLASCAVATARGAPVTDTPALAISAEHAWESANWAKVMRCPPGSRWPITVAPWKVVGCSGQSGIVR